MSGWEAPSVSSVNISIPSANINKNDVSHNRVQSQQQYEKFIRTYQSDDTSKYIYREQLQNNYRQGVYTLNVDMAHIKLYNEELFDLLVEYPIQHIHTFENAAKQVAIQICSIDTTTTHVYDIQIILMNYNKYLSLRQLNSKYMNQLVEINGIIISAGKPRMKATKLNIMCRNCKVTKFINVGNGFGSILLPRQCDTQVQPGTDMQKCGLDPYIILPDSTECIDQQRVKLQEFPESVPTGELPRNVDLALERSLVGSIKPGNRVTVVGMYTTYEASSKNENKRTGSDGVGIRLPYVRVFGITHISSANDILNNQFSTEEENYLKNLPHNNPNLYQDIVRSMCPAIHDTEDNKYIKQALALQLFGGQSRMLDDGLRLRGDINILLLGDPSTAKSQFLKFAYQSAPIGIYTSGKGSSASGLTASVIRDPSSSEFHLEGGALVLGDGGLVCIDEFDKMKEEDRVAIHEAMEQQTISIAKAGITTQLNSRCSVLAAANPVFGRYDDMKSPTENIDFQTSILSRFDMIFIVRDIQNEERDIMLSKHVINVHKLKDNFIKTLNNDDNNNNIISSDLLKKYIAFARMYCHPTMNDAAHQTLKNYYQLTREEVANKTMNIKGSTAGNVIPITVRQLEAIVRMAEARARIELSDVVNEEHMAAAMRLFEVSTMRAAKASYNESGVLSREFQSLVKQCEVLLYERVSIGSSVPYKTVLQYLRDRGLKDEPIKMAIHNLVQKGNIQEKSQGRLLYRYR